MERDASDPPGAQEAPRGTVRHARETLASVRARIDYLADRLDPDASPAIIGTHRRVLWHVSRDVLAAIRDLDDMQAPHSIPQEGAGYGC